jgi:hypothetical protein
MINFGRGANIDGVMVTAANAFMHQMLYKVYLSFDGTTYKEVQNNMVVNRTQESIGKIQAAYTWSTVKVDTNTSELVLVPLVFNTTQIGVQKIKIVLYGNTNAGQQQYNVLTEVDAFVNKP